MQFVFKDDIIIGHIVLKSACFEEAKTAQKQVASSYKFVHNSFTASFNMHSIPVNAGIVNTCSKHSNCHLVEAYPEKELLTLNIPTTRYYSICGKAGSGSPLRHRKGGFT